MPNVTEQTYSDSLQASLSAEIAADLVTAGTSGCKLIIFNQNDIPCCTFNLADPPTLVTPENKLSLITDSPSSPIVASGTATYVELQKADSTVVLSMPVRKSNTPVRGAFGLNSLTLISGSSINLVSVIIS